MTGRGDYKKTVERSYRQLVRGWLPPMHVTVRETDLCVYARGISTQDIREAVITQRGHLEGYIERFPKFAQTLVPWPEDALAPPIVRDMILAGRTAAVGPMAAVAGAVAERIGRDLLSRTDEIIVENGGDIFIKTLHPLTVAVFAGHSPLSLNIGIEIQPASQAMAVCTSSGSVGHSFSEGLADAVCVLSRSCALADAAATAMGNRVRHSRDIQPAIHWGRTISGVEGILVIIGEKMGVWGEIQLKPLRHGRTEKKVEF